MNHDNFFSQRDLYFKVLCMWVLKVVLIILFLLLGNGKRVAHDRFRKFILTLIFLVLCRVHASIVVSLSYTLSKFFIDFKKMHWKILRFMLHQILDQSSISFLFIHLCTIIIDARCVHTSRVVFFKSRSRDIWNGNLVYRSFLKINGAGPNSNSFISIQ